MVSAEGRTHQPWTELDRASVTDEERAPGSHRSALARRWPGAGWMWPEKMSLRPLRPAVDTCVVPDSAASGARISLHVDLVDRFIGTRDHNGDKSGEIQIPTPSLATSVCFHDRTNTTLLNNIRLSSPCNSDTPLTQTPNYTCNSTTHTQRQHPTAQPTFDTAMIGISLAVSRLVSRSVVETAGSAAAAYTPKIPNQELENTSRDKKSPRVASHASGPRVPGSPSSTMTPVSVSSGPSQGPLCVTDKSPSSVNVAVGSRRRAPTSAPFVTMAPPASSSGHRPQVVNMHGPAAPSNATFRLSARAASEQKLNSQSPKAITSNSSLKPQALGSPYTTCTPLATTYSHHPLTYTADPHAAYTPLSHSSSNDNTSACQSPSPEVSKLGKAVAKQGPLASVGGLAIGTQLGRKRGSANHHIGVVLMDAPSLMRHVECARMGPSPMVLGHVDCVDNSVAVHRLLRKGVAPVSPKWKSEDLAIYEDVYLCAY
eukprot:gene32127-16649_t